MRRAVLHLGLPKCGSSALQVGLRANVTRLLEHGILYPLHRRRERGDAAMGHMALAAELVRAANSPILTDYLAAFERSDAHTLVLSSESLAGRLRAIRAELVAPLAEMDVVAVLFTRRADLQTVSAYKHLVRRERHTGDFAAFVAQSERGTIRRPAMNIGATMREARRLFPRSSFQLLDLDSRGGDSVPLFGEVLGVPLADWPVEPYGDARRRNARLMRLGLPINQSLSNSKTLFLLACNRSPMSDEAVRAVDAALLGLPDPPADDLQLLTAAESRRLLDCSLEHNRAVETEFGIALARHRPLPIPDTAPTALSAGEARALADALTDRLDPAVAEQLAEVAF